MAITNHERVGKALELLKAGLAPFFEREIKNVYQAKAQAEATRLLASTAGNLSPTGMLRPSSTNVMWEGWNEVFRRTLGPAERSLVSELRDHRNKCAHQHSFSGDDAYRALDSAGCLLTAVSAPQGEDVEPVLKRVRANPAKLHLGPVWVGS